MCEFYIFFSLNKKKHQIFGFRKKKEIFDFKHIIEKS